MADQTQQQQQPQPQVPQTQAQPQQMAQQMPQPQQQQLQQIQQQPRVSSVGTVSIQGMVAQQAPTPQPTLTAATNAMRSPTTPMPQLQVIGQPMHGQSYLQQFQGYAQPFMLQNANALAAMQQMNQLNLAMQQQQQQQNRAAAGANPGSPGGILSPNAASQMSTHMSLGNGSNLISTSMPGLMTQTGVASGNKGQGNGGKGQTVQGQGQNATAAIASMVAKQATVMPTQQTASAPVVLGQIGVFSNQGNPGMGSNFVPQCTVSTHQGGLRLNQTQMVNSAGQIITSQPMQSILTNQAIMQAMASLQMQQGIPIAATAGHQQILNPGQSQMPTIFAGQNFLIRAPGPLPSQPLTMTSMQAAFAGMKAQQPQQQQQNQQQVGKPQTNMSGKVMLPSVTRAPITAKIQPNLAQSVKLNVPGVPKAAKPRPKAMPRTVPSSSIMTASASPVIVKSLVVAATTTTAPATAVVTSLPGTTAVVSVPVALSIHAPEGEAAPPVLTRVPLPPHPHPPSHPPHDAAAAVKTQPGSELEPGKTLPMTVPATTVDLALKAKIKATVASCTPATPTTAVVAASTGMKSYNEISAPVRPNTAVGVSGDKMTIDDVILEEKPVISTVVKSGSSINAAMEAAGLMTLIKESKPMTAVEPSPFSQGPPPVIERQRAIVKPQILTHIIEGFIIQEGPEPFPVQQSSLLQEFIPPKASSQILKESEEDGTSCDDEPPTLLSQVDAHLSSTQLLSRQPQQQDEKDEQKSSLKLLKCELCQKMAPSTTFNNSQRFCSLSCSRRHNVSHTRRVGLFKSRAGSARKRKHILGRKNWHDSKGDRLSYGKTSGDNSNDEQNEDSNNALVGDGMSSSNSTRETSSSADSPPRSQEYDMDIEVNIPRTDPGKWTVTEVYDFIQSMPGCREYAEEFRSQEIDGQALLLLKEDHLMAAMSIKLGPALKICSKINSLKTDSAPS